ncbi:MAG: carboxypeptidase-like regulatory domain-containing protein [Candidatus Marinimicrobia bacterium]|nr:carboxypeptidase-like regulatory domain-containing protein [Candidatus Neomarinimicrobiota bacterium]
MKHLIVFITALALMLSTAEAQTVLHGTVINAKTRQPVIAASVQEPETRRGTYTDKNGEFSLTVPELPVRIRITHIGYAEQTAVCDSSEITHNPQADRSAR